MLGSRLKVDRIISSSLLFHTTITGGQLKISIFNVMLNTKASNNAENENLLSIENLSSGGDNEGDSVVGLHKFELMRKISNVKACGY